MNCVYIYGKDGSCRSRSLQLDNGIASAPFTTETDRIEFHFAAFRVPVGSEGYFLLPNICSELSCGGLICFKKRPDVIEEYDKGFSMPVFGVASGASGALAVVTQGRYDYALRVEVKDGFYHLVPVFKNCTADPIVKLFPLEGKNASYSGMAKTYRDYQIARGACKPLKERIINN